MEGLLGQAMGRQTLECSAVEFVFLTPPSGQTCGKYMERFISDAGGYLTNPETSSFCQFCSFNSSDKFLETNFNIFYENHWRDFGILIAFGVFNVGHICIRQFPLLHSIFIDVLYISFHIPVPHPYRELTPIFQTIHQEDITGCQYNITLTVLCVIPPFSR